jgi:crotonobetainyl-CoA:carnitine CoA-transferase CaiB-like acyl-CoA transferase
MVVAVEDDRLDRPILVPGVAPRLSRTPGSVPPLAQLLGAATEAIRERTHGAPGSEHRATSEVVGHARSG